MGRMAGTARTQHSGMGLLSFGLAVVCGGGFLCLLALAWLFERWRAAQPLGQADAPGTGLLLLFFMLMGVFFLLVAVVLGVAGMLQRRRRRLYAALGTVVSVVVLTIGCLTWLVPMCESNRKTLCTLRWHLPDPPKVHYAQEPPEG